MTENSGPAPWSPPRQQAQAQGQQQATGDLGQAFHYPQGVDFRDEVFGADGEQQAHWRYLLESLEALGQEAIAERQLKALRILRDDGATYNLSADPLAQRRIWGLDPVPLLLDSEEWSEIEGGLVERAELLDLTLKDIYGPRDLIRHGVLPPELIFSHRGFLRPCQNISLPSQHHLILHSADLVRDTEGKMCVISDRTQAPSGAGYALENRTVMSRVLPSLFRDSHVHRLAMFFQTLRLKLSALCPHADMPQVVVLTPGAYSETYFEHALLANYLGYPLVQGGDLTVRGGYVWMKSLDGLQRVDVILRRVDDDYCDAVELRSDSQLGVPGLLDVVRSGRIVVANPLGSGVLENPALIRYLPAIGKFFLGREPRLSSVRTYWCGDPNDLRYVRDNIQQLVIKATYRRPGNVSVYGGDLSDHERQTLLDHINARPMQFAAQEYQGPSSAPGWSGSGLVPRPVVLRSFAVASPSSYSIMPGGLTRAGSRDDIQISSARPGTTSKDTWVLASEPEKQISLLKDGAGGVAAGLDQGAHLPSRVAENLFWMGRYGERAEAALRLLRTVFVQINSIDPISAEARDVLLRAVTCMTATFPGFDEGAIASPEAVEQELLSVILDASRAGSITANLQAMLNSSEEVKEMLSADTQRVLNDISDALSDLESALRFGLSSAPEEALDPLVTALLALAGLSHESMMRGMGWRFLEMGRILERSYQMTSLLQAALVETMGNSDQITVLESVLLSFEVLVSYRRRYRARPEMASALQLLMVDHTNPRSLQFQLSSLQSHIQDLPGPAGVGGLQGEARAVLEALTAVQLAEPQSLLASDDDGRREALSELLERVRNRLEHTAELLSDKYFDHQVGHQQLVDRRWEDE